MGSAITSYDISIEQRNVAYIFVACFLIPCRDTKISSLTLIINVEVIIASFHFNKSTQMNE
jgi:hypothetical protein